MKIFPIDKKHRYSSWDSFFYCGEAIEKGNFIEAFLLLHMLIHEELMGCISIELMLKENSPERKKKESKHHSIKTNELVNFDYKTTARVALFMGVINEDAFHKIMKFNSLRNKMSHCALNNKFTHKFLKKSAEEGWELAGQLDSLHSAMLDELDLR